MSWVIPLTNYLSSSNDKVINDTSIHDDNFLDDNLQDDKFQDEYLIQLKKESESLMKKFDQRINKYQIKINKTTEELKE